MLEFLNNKTLKETVQYATKIK